MSKWLSYWKYTSSNYFLKLVWITILIKIGIQISRTYKVTLEILENTIKQQFNFSIGSGIVHIETIINQKKIRCYLRWNSSDILVYKQIILQRELEPIVKFFNSSEQVPNIMIDAGANIGLSSVYIRAHFPMAKIICIEPNKENVAMLYKNLGHANCQLLQKALWYQKSFLKEDQTTGEAWGIKMLEMDEEINGAVESITLMDIIKLFKLSKIDYLKIDIEGAEEGIFYKDSLIRQVLNKTTCLSIEPHSVEFEKFVIKYLNDAEFQVSQSGELVIGF